jgi:hypothetical protein
VTISFLSALYNTLNLRLEKCEDGLRSSDTGPCNDIQIRRISSTMQSLHCSERETASISRTWAVMWFTVFSEKKDQEIKALRSR